MALSRGLKFCRPCLALLMAFNMSACTTPVSEPRGFGIRQLPHRKHEIDSQAAQKEAVKTMRDCLTRVLYSGGGSLPEIDTDQELRSIQSTAPPSLETSEEVRSESTNDCTESASETARSGAALPAKRDSFAVSSAFVASVPTQKGGSAFWIPSQTPHNDKLASSECLKQEGPKSEAVNEGPPAGTAEISRVEATLASEEGAEPSEAEEEESEPNKKSSRMWLPGGGPGLKRAVSYEAINEDGNLRGETYALPHTEKLAQTVETEAENNTIAVSTSGHVTPEDVASSSDEEAKSRRRRVPWLPFLNRKPKAEAEAADETGQEGSTQKRRPAMWLPSRAPTADTTAEPARTKKQRAAPWIPPSPPQVSQQKEEDRPEQDGRKARPAMWLPGQSAPAPVEQAPKRKGMWLPNQAAPSAPAPAKPGRGKPWVPPTPPATNGMQKSGDGWPAAGGKVWKPKYDMTKGMEEEQSGGGEQGPSWKPKYDMSKSLDAAEAGPPVGKAKERAGVGAEAKEGNGVKLHRSASPGTLKLQERRREMEEREVSMERRRRCDRCKQLCKGAWMMGYDMVHCSEACLKQTEEGVCSAWAEGWDSVEAFLRPRGGPRLFPNAVVPGLGIRPGA